MKNFLIIIALVALSCTQRPQDSQSVGDLSPTPVTPERIILVDNGGITWLYIYKVDGHEYIASAKGGIIHSESCPCKPNSGRIK